METTKKVFIGAGIVAAIVLVVCAAWFLFNRSTPTATTPGTTIKNTQSFTTSNTATQETPLTADGQQIDTSGTTAPEQKIFKIADGPVMGALFIQTSNPTTTLARYTMQDNGHVFDMPVNVPGAIARVVSNITIPGLRTELWLGPGKGTILQYVEGSVIKTLYLGFPVASTTAATSSPPVIRFFPDNITGIAASPDGTLVTYLLKTTSGTVGYIAGSNTTNPKILFTLPFSQLLISWSSTHTLLVQMKEATGVPGMAFSLSYTGELSPLLYADSLSATANANFSKVVYQSTSETTSQRTTYVHDVQSGHDTKILFNPLPEKCVWGNTNFNLMYCAAPLSPTPSNYLDLWHLGATNVADDIFSFDVAAGITSMLASPGSPQGGTQSEIDQIAVSPDGQYLLYITRGDRTLWGVHIGR